MVTAFGESGWQNGTTCTVVGVTITNGAGLYGGGILGNDKNSSPNNYINVRRCNIIENNNCFKFNILLLSNYGVTLSYVERNLTIKININRSS